MDINVKFEIMVDGELFEQPYNPVTLKRILDLAYEIVGNSMNNTPLVADSFAGTGNGEEVRREYIKPPPGHTTVDYAIKAWFNMGRPIVTTNEITERMLKDGWQTSSMAPAGAVRAAIVASTILWERVGSKGWRYIGPPVSLERSNGEKPRPSLDELAAAEERQLREIADRAKAGRPAMSNGDNHPSLDEEDDVKLAGL
jgi:hypothetical protein